MDLFIRKAYQFGYGPHWIYIINNYQECRILKAFK